MMARDRFRLAQVPRLLVETAARRPWRTLVLAAVIAGAALAATTGLHPGASISAMLSEGQPSVTSLLRITTGYRGVDDLLIVLAADEGGDGIDVASGIGSDRGGDAGDAARTATLITAARDIEMALRSAPIADSIDTITWRSDGDLEFTDFVAQHVAPSLLLLVDDATLDSVLEHLEPDEMVASLDRLGTMIAAPGPAAAAAARQLARDPMGVYALLAAGISREQWAGRDGQAAWLAPGGRHLLIRITAREPSEHIAFATELVEQVRRTAETTLPRGVTLRMGGTYAIASRAASAIRSDLIVSIITAMIAIQVLFLIGYRNLAAFPVAALPVGVGVLTGFGLYAALGQTLTPVTAVIGGLLAGLGVDFCIHFLSRWEGRRAAGDDVATALSGAATAVGPSMLIAGMTTIIGFATIAFSSVLALRQFGLLGALGLGAAVIAALTVLPALLSVVHRAKSSDETSGAQHSRHVGRPARRGRATLVERAGRPRSAVFAVLLTHEMRHPRTVIGAAVLAAAGTVLVSMAVHGPVPPIDGDLSVMHPRPSPPLELQDDIVEVWGASPSDLLVHIRAEDDSSLLRRAWRVRDALDSDAIRASGVSGVSGITSFLPDPDRADARRTRLKTIDPERFADAFDAALAAGGFAPAPFAEYRAAMMELLRPPPAPRVTDLIAEGSGAAMLLPRDGAVETVVAVQLDRALTTDAALTAATRSVRQALRDIEEVTLTGISVVGHDSRLALLTDLKRLLLVAGAAVVLFLLLVLRSPVAVLLVLVPVAFGLASAVVVLWWSPYGLNMVSLLALPLLVGLGVDDGVFLLGVHRSRRDRPDALPEFADACHAVTMTSLTTAVAIGSLAATSVPAIRGLGVVTGAGVLGCLCGTLLVLAPALLRRHRHGRSCDDVGGVGGSIDRGTDAGYGN